MGSMDQFGAFLDLVFGILVTLVVNIFLIFWIIMIVKDFIHTMKYGEQVKKK